MAGPLRTPLLLLASLALTLALAVAVNPGTSPRNAKSTLVGGALDADVNEEGVQQALNFALSEYNKASNDAYHSRAMRVVRARKQVVAGMKYFLEVEIGRTRCTKSQPNLDSCPFHDQPHLMRKTLCSFQIYTVPWLGRTSLVKSSCQDA
ncbi:cystatin-C [Callorhinus ursinus]|uniref:Cystatin-C-like n=2 Tax=Otariidae TaxID=9702 RepID=A0A3Q7PRY4_CALUR|nr:cystatin-C-like [Callorhinus ursinus]XP_027979551.1 cystatin-C-like [Eumetopias jubatus]XP_035584772.1 cystatin-C-like [Zalophus californianus]